MNTCFLDDKILTTIYQKPQVKLLFPSPTIHILKGHCRCLKEKLIKGNRENRNQKQIKTKSRRVKEARTYPFISIKIKREVSKLGKYGILKMT